MCLICCRLRSPLIFSRSWALRTLLSRSFSDISISCQYLAPRFPSTFRYQYRSFRSLCFSTFSDDSCASCISIASSLAHRLRATLTLSTKDNVSCPVRDGGVRVRRAQQAQTPSIWTRMSIRTVIATVHRWNLCDCRETVFGEKGTQ